MVRGVREVQRLEGGKGRLLERRRVVGAAVFAFGMWVGAGVSESADAAKKRKKTEDGKKGKKGKDRQNGKASEAASTSGKDVVRVAQKYKGSKYTWGGASPKGFDCSGFTWYVYHEATGMDITRGVDEQWRLGHSVRHGDWQAGDIVFFKNTFERGLSHCGIYIGGNQFIHSPHTGDVVTISSLSGWYTSTWVGAKRL
jgi:cell wall-associated NlpC family hydrolase